MPGILGAVFAVSGLRALVMMALLGGEAAASGVAASILTLLYLIAVFAIGIVISMSLFGVVLSRVLGSVARAARGARRRDCDRARLDGAGDLLDREDGVSQGQKG